MNNHVNEDAIRNGLRESFAITKHKGCFAEVLMKDLHTVQADPRRIRRWVELALEARDRVYGV